MHRRLPEDLALLRTEEVERTLGAPDVPLGHLGVPGRGLDRRVAEQPLDSADVGARLEKVCGEAVTQGMSGDALFEAALDYDLVQYTLDRARRDGPTRDGPGEQEASLRACGLPVRPQDVEQALAEHHVAVLRALALVNVDEHALAVDIGGLQRARFRNPEPGTVGRHQDRAMLERPDLLEELLDLLASEDIWQALGSLGPRDLRDHLGTVQRRRIEELDGGDIHVLRRRTSLPLVHEVQQEVADLLLPELCRRAPVVVNEVVGALQVLLLRRRRESTQLEIGRHLVPDGSHGVLLWRDHRQPSSSRAGARPCSTRRAKTVSRATALSEPPRSGLVQEPLSGAVRYPEASALRRRRWLPVAQDNAGNGSAGARVDPACLAFRNSRRATHGRSWSSRSGALAASAGRRLPRT